MATLLLWAAPAAAGAEGLTGTLLEFGTARAQLWAILEERPRGGAAFAFALADQLALNPKRTDYPYVAGTVLSASPLLTYDRNVNSGFTSDTIYILGLPFEVDEEDRAVEAITLGGAVSGGLSLGVAPGTTMGLSARSAYQRAVGAEFEVTSNVAAFGLSHTAQDWTYLDAGLRVSEEERDLSEQDSTVASLTVGKLFGAGGSHLHDLSATYIRAEENSTWQSRVRLDWAGTFRDLGMIKLGLERGEVIDGTSLPVTSVSGAYSSVLWGAPMTVSALYSKETGGDFFGEPRNDENYVIKVERKIGKRFSVYLSYEMLRSSIGGFDDSGVDIGFDFTGFRF